MWRVAVLAIYFVCGSHALLAEDHPVEILRLSQEQTAPGEIDYAALPRIGGAHAVVSAATIDSSAIDEPKIDLHNIRLQLHNYLVHHAGRYWCIWSDGPRVEDEPTQQVSYATSIDGISWSRPLITNFPNATSKLFSMQTSRGFRVLALNANPTVGRRELYLAISLDGRHFTQLALLDIPSPAMVENRATEVWHKFRTGVASLQYPHLIEHDDHLLIAFSRNKNQTEVFRVSLADVEKLVFP